MPDLNLAKSYYDAVLPMLGYTEFLSSTDQVAYRPADGKHGTYLFLYPAAGLAGYSRHQTGLQHLAFMVTTRSQVFAVHQFVRALGAVVIHEPRAFPEYPPPYFATFWLDPFGFMLEAVCHKEQR